MCVGPIDVLTKAMRHVRGWTNASEAQAIARKGFIKLCRDLPEA
jgi:hypothetical protein